MSGKHFVTIGAMQLLVYGSRLLLPSLAYELTQQPFYMTTDLTAFVSLSSTDNQLQSGSGASSRHRFLRRSGALEYIDTNDEVDSNFDNFTDMKQMRFCPDGCLKYTSDGCNSCVCDHAGMIQSCTRRFCALPGPSKCLQFDHNDDSSQESEKTSTSTMPPHSSTFKNSDNTSNPLPKCPVDCRVFKPDACNECFCSSQGVTKWCSDMTCDRVDNTLTCLEFLDGKRVDNESNDNEFSTTEQVLITTQAGDDPTSQEKDENIPTVSEPVDVPVPDLKPIPDADALPGIPTPNCGPPDQLLDQCPPMCALALINCHICSCDSSSSKIHTPQGTNANHSAAIEWCTPCIERCNMRRIACLDVSVAGTSLEKDHMISTNISELKVHIHITNNTITHAPGSIQCDEQCNVNTLNVSAIERPLLGSKQAEVAYPIINPSFNNDADNGRQHNESILPLNSSNNVHPQPKIDEESSNKRLVTRSDSKNKGIYPISQQYSTPTANENVLECSRLLNLRYNQDNNGLTLFKTNMSHINVKLCPLVSMGCFFCECDTQRDRLKRCGVWDRWNMKKCFPLLMDSVHDGNLRSDFDQNELAGSLHLPQCVRDFQIKANLDDISNILNNNNIDGQSLLSWIMLHSIPSFHQIWHMLTKGIHWPSSLKISNPLPTGSLPFHNHQHRDDETETKEGDSSHPSMWARALQLALRFLFALDSNELHS